MTDEQKQEYKTNFDRAIKTGLWDFKQFNEFNETDNEVDYKKGHRVICIDISTPNDSDFYEDLLTIGKEYEIIGLPENGVRGSFISVIADNGNKINVFVDRFEYPEYFRRGRDLLWDLKD